MTLEPEGRIQTLRQHSQESACQHVFPYFLPSAPFSSTFLLFSVSNVFLQRFSAVCCEFSSETSVALQVGALYHQPSTPLSSSDLQKKDDDSRLACVSHSVFIGNDLCLYNDDDNSVSIICGDDDDESFQNHHVHDSSSTSD